MKEYLLAVTGIVLFSSIVIAILPNGKMNEMMKSIARMACVLCIVSPLVDFFVGNKNIPSIFEESGIEMQSEFIEYCSNERVMETEELLVSELKNIAPMMDSLKIIWTTETIHHSTYQGSIIKIDKIIIYMAGENSDSFDEKIRSYMRENYGVEYVEVVTDGYK